MRRAITDPDDVIEAFLHDPAERIIRTHTAEGSEWHLERDRRQVTGSVAELLCCDGAFPYAFRGRLIPAADGLLPGTSQTFTWCPAGPPHP